MHPGRSLTWHRWATSNYHYMARRSNWISASAWRNYYYYYYLLNYRSYLKDPTAWDDSILGCESLRLWIIKKLISLISHFVCVCHDHHSPDSTLKNSVSSNYALCACWTDTHYNGNITTAIKSWPATVVSQETGSLPQWLRITPQPASVVNIMRLSKLVDNSDRWTMFIPWDGQQMDDRQTNSGNQCIAGLWGGPAINHN